MGWEAEIAHNSSAQQSEAIQSESHHHCHAFIRKPLYSLGHYGDDGRAGQVAGPQRAAHKPRMHLLHRVPQYE